jgi:hypothetical protein
MTITIAERNERILRQVHGIADPVDDEPVAEQKKIWAEGAVSSKTSGMWRSALGAEHLSAITWMGRQYRRTRRDR